MRLGFGLNVAPKIMSAIMNMVMSQDGEIQRAMTSYIDDVYINENVASSRRVKEHLECFGLVGKTLELLQNGANVLRLHVSGNGKQLRWSWGSDILEVPPVITRRSTFSMCGKLVVCSWLRVVAAAMKHCVISVTSRWDDKVHDVTIRCMITETMERIMQDNPVWSDWCVNKNELCVWVDARSLVMGVIF